MSLSDNRLRASDRATPTRPGIEGAIARIGRGPAAVGKVLDRWARGAQPMRGLVGFFSSIRMGLLWLALTAAYIAIGSGFAGIRAALEMTDLEFFDAWPMVMLIFLLATTLAVVTLRRIPLTLYKLGVWTVHVGILTLLTGCFIYFSQKQEGSVRIFLNQTVGEYYDATERALYLRRMDPNDHAKPLMRDGKAAPMVMVPLANMPIYGEHLSADLFPQGADNPLDLRISGELLGQADPALKDLSLHVVGYYPDADLTGPTAAGPLTTQPLNPRIHLELEMAAQNESPHVVPRGRADGAPAALRQDLWLVAKPVARRVSESPESGVGIEFLHHPTAQRRAELSTSFQGPYGLTVRVPGRHIEHTYRVELGQAITVEGTAYTLTPQEVLTMPMLSAGYQGTQSSALLVDVEKQADVATAPAAPLAYQRQAVFRFPERSPDFIKSADDTMKRVQNRVDNDLELVFHDATQPQFWIVQDEHEALTLIHRARDGQVALRPLAVGKKVMLPPAGDGAVGITVLEITNNAIELPRIVPARQRPARVGATRAMFNSVAVVEIGRRGGGSGDKTEAGARRVFVPFVQFAATSGPPLGREPAIVEVPGVGLGGGVLQMILSTVQRELPVQVTLTDFQLVKRPGARWAIKDYISGVRFRDKDTGAMVEGRAALNHPATDRGLRYFQAEWDGNENASPGQRFTVLGVGNRPGVLTMTVGALLMITGILYTFYVKPILLQRKKQRLADSLSSV